MVSVIIDKQISINSRVKRLPQAGLHVHCLVVKDAMYCELPLNSKDHLVLNCQSVWVSIVWAVLVTMSLYMCNIVELVSLPYSYFLRLDTSTGLSSKEAFELFLRLQPTDVYKELVPRTEEGKMCWKKRRVTLFLLGNLSCKVLVASRRTVLSLFDFFYHL